MCFASDLFFPRGRILSNDFRSRLTPPPPRAPWPRRRNSAVVPFTPRQRPPDAPPFPRIFPPSVLGAVTIRTRFHGRALFLRRFLSSASARVKEVVEANRSTNDARFVFPRRGRGRGLRLASLGPPLHDDDHRRNQGRSPPEQFYPFVGKRWSGPVENQATTLPRPFRPRVLRPRRRGLTTPFVVSVILDAACRRTVNYQRPDNSVIRAQCAPSLSRCPLGSPLVRPWFSIATGPMPLSVFLSVGGALARGSARSCTRPQKDTPLHRTGIP